MTTAGDRLLLSSVKEMGETLSAARIVHYDYRAAFDDSAPAPSGDIDIDLTIATSVRLRPTGVDYRLAVKAPLPTGEIVVDQAMMFEGKQRVAFARGAVRAFGEEVAYPALYPYVRQSLAELTSRVVGTPIELPLLAPRDISVDVDDFDEIIAVDEVAEAD